MPKPSGRLAERGLDDLSLAVIIIDAVRSVTCAPWWPWAWTIRAINTFWASRAGATENAVTCQGPLDADSRFRRVRGYAAMHVLLNCLGLEVVDSVSSVA